MHQMICQAIMTRQIFSNQSLATQNVPNYQYLFPGFFCRVFFSYRHCFPLRIKYITNADSFLSIAGLHAQILCNPNKSVQEQLLRRVFGTSHTQYLKPVKDHILYWMERSRAGTKKLVSKQNNCPFNCLIQPNCPSSYMNFTS